MVPHRYRHGSHLVVVVLRVKLAILGETIKAHHLVLYNWLRLPVVDPLLLLEQVIDDGIDFLEWLLLDAGPSFMSGTILDMIEVVVIGLHADLAVSVLLIWYRLKQGLVMPILNIVICFDCLLKIFVILLFSSFLDFIEMKHCQ